MTYKNIINKLRRKYLFLGKEEFLPAQNGTIHKVFISPRYVIRLRDRNTEILERESDLLKQINSTIIPKVLAEGKFEGLAYVIENRLSGKTINSVWSTLSDKNKLNIIDQLVNFLKFLRTQKNNKFYSVETGKVYANFYDFLTDEFEVKKEKIQKFPEAKDLLKKLLKIIKKPEAAKLFLRNPVLTHGDLIFHNLLTDRQNLTGVLDWELSFYGDPEYDIFRLMNFKKSAKIYLDRDEDKEFEFDYLDQLLGKIEKSDLIDNKKRFMAKYEIAKAVYYLDALNWAAESNDPKKYILETIEEWEN